MPYYRVKRVKRVGRESAVAAKANRETLVTRCNAHSEPATPLGIVLLPPSGFLRCMPFPERDGQKSEAEQTLRAQVDLGIRDLLGEMQQGRSERLTRYLEFSARFHKYSLHNQFLIYLQCPHATFVAGYRKWQEWGYQVKKGEKGIRILAPRLTEKEDKETHEVRQVMYFVPVSVFDASQLIETAEKPLPLFFTPLADDQPELYARLVQVVQENGIRIEESALGLTQGASMGRRIALREDADSRSKFLTLLHEYTHELLHWTPEAKAQSAKAKECHAEVVSYVVAHHFGIHNPFSADYLQHWGNTSKELYEELEIVRHTAAHIIQQLEEPRVEIALVDGHMLDVEGTVDATRRNG